MLTFANITGCICVIFHEPEFFLFGFPVDSISAVSRVRSLMLPEERPGWLNNEHILTFN